MINLRQWFLLITIEEKEQTQFICLSKSDFKYERNGATLPVLLY